MNNYVLALIFFLLTAGGVVVRKTYYYVPSGELKRRAEHNDPLAVRLYPAVSYGGSLRALLWLYIGFMSAATIILLARALPIWASLLIVSPLLWATFSWLPTSRVSSFGARLTALVSPLILWLLSHLHSVLGRGSEVVQKRTTIHQHTGLFEREDLIELIEEQQRQPDSRLSENELEVARRALNFSEYKVRDVLIPRKVVKTALATDTIGPVLIDELHKNGQGYMLVLDKPKGDFVGVVAFSQLNLKSNGQLKNVMDKSIYYLHENDSLSQALHAFFTTHKPVFVVVNSSEEYVGIITVDGILRQLLGHIPGDDFEGYHDKPAVAARHIKRDKKEESKDAEQIEAAEEQESAEPPEKDEQENTPVKTDEEVVK